MLKKIRHTVAENLINMLGLRTNRKIVVFESDDWGMIRMASKESYDWFLSKDYRVDECPYNSNDALESNRDLELLFEVLHSVKDCIGNSAIFTANNIVGNPDFERIRKSGFRDYYFEPMPETLKKYPGRGNVMDLYKEGIAQNVFRPQFHGREHLNVNRWMEGLSAGDKVARDAFEQNMFTVHQSGSVNGRRDCMDAFGIGYNKEWVSLEEIIKSGLDLFENLWGYRSLSFIAPCYVWPGEIESILSENGVKYIQGTHVQRVPSQNGGYGISKKYHYTGQKNQFGQRYLVRNADFEPTVKGQTGAVESTLKQIQVAFRHKKPAIIGTHRVNYMGSLRPENRDKNLKLLATLLNRIISKYPDIEFMSSDQLGNFITGES